MRRLKTILLMNMLKRWGAIAVYKEWHLELGKNAGIDVLSCLFTDRAVALGQDLSKIPFKDRSWLGYKTRSRKFCQT